MRLDIPHQRLHNQRISSNLFDKPEDVVAYMGAVQAQDYPAAQWALGLRMRGATASTIEQAFNDGTILRTHVMRPTWHFVTPADIRWLLALTAPRVHALNAYYYRKLELDDALFASTNSVLTKALQHGNYLTRTELATALHQNGIDTYDNLRLNYLLIHAELDAVICSGPRWGKQHTYALLDERAPFAKTLARDDALAVLAARYFISHGPASMKDYVWWSGLSTPAAKAGIEMVKSDLHHELVNGTSYWLAPTPHSVFHIPHSALLPNFDEYTVGYADRSAYISRAPDIATSPFIALGNIVVIDGQIVGAWRRTLGKGEVSIAIEPFTDLTDAEKDAIAAAAGRYGTFLGTPLVLL